MRLYVLTDLIHGAAKLVYLFLPFLLLQTLTLKLFLGVSQELILICDVSLLC